MESIQNTKISGNINNQFIETENHSELFNILVSDFKIACDKLIQKNDNVNTMYFTINNENNVLGDNGIVRICLYCDDTTLTLVRN